MKASQHNALAVPTLDLVQAQRIAASYPAEAAHTPRYERERYMTETQQLGWLIRFDPERAAEVLSATKAQQTTQSRVDRIRHRSIPHHGSHNG